MQAVFDAAKTQPVQFQPFLGVELLGFRAGQQGDVLVLATLALAEQASGLSRQGKTNLLRGDRLGHDRAADQVAFVVVQGAEVGGRRLPRGENPPWGRGAVARCSGEPWAGCPWPSADSRPRLPAPVRERFAFAYARHPAKPTGP